jgi:hypothetical protein
MQLYGSVVGMFELNNLALAVPSPVEDYFLLVDGWGEAQERCALKAATDPLLDALDTAYDTPCEGGWVGGCGAVWRASGGMVAGRGGGVSGCGARVLGAAALLLPPVCARPGGVAAGWQGSGRRRPSRLMLRACAAAGG